MVTKRVILGKNDSGGFFEERIFSNNDLEGKEK